MHTRHVGLMGILVGSSLALACGDDDEGQGPPPGSIEQTGSTCASVAECYPSVDHAQLSGEVLCLDEVRDGYCTHQCAADADCCGTEGECATDLEQVCSPFESTGGTMCFLSCEGIDNGDEFCQAEASPYFGCRSSGGGSDNRKICMPVACGVGASCAGDGDCDAGLTCNRDYAGGYCGAGDCAADADCGADAVCVTAPGGGNVCLHTCAADTDCTLCRADLSGSRCTGDVQLVESSGVTVCSPFPN